MEDGSVFERLHVERMKDILQQALQQKLVFLIIGRTGVGKSSTVNTLIGKEVAAVNPLAVGTESVRFYQVNVQGVTCEVVDTPGLCDTLDAANDQAYLEEMKAQIKTFDCLWFVTPLHETRVRSDEKRGIRLISDTSFAWILVESWAYLAKYRRRSVEAWKNYMYRTESGIIGLCDGGSPAGGSVATSREVE
jgi:small GTP-binding protein